jgi:hypothetical protein
MSCTFGYMIFIIVYKWCIDYTKGGSPPNLIQVTGGCDCGRGA